MDFALARKDVSSLLLSVLVGLQLGATAGAEPAQDAVASAPRRFTNQDVGAPLTEPAPPLEWSANPGVFEAELKRRYDNPLYPASRRQVAEEELLEARRRDAELMWVVLENYIDLASGKNRMARFEVASQMGDALLRIDEGTWEALRAGGKAYDLAASIQKLRKTLLQEWRAVAAIDPGVKALLDAEARLPSVETDSAVVRFLALIQTAGDDENGPIRSYEFGTALLSEEPEAIRGVYKALRGDLKRTMRKQLTRTLEEIGRDDVQFEGRAQKISVVAKLLGRTPADFGIDATTLAN